jgi:hypothetical protein
MKLIILPLLAFIFFSCATNKPTQKSNLTFANVKRTIIKGQTNQSEIIQFLGSPNITTRNKKSEEVWTYSRQSYDTESGSFGGVGVGVGGGLFGIFGGSKAFDTSSSATFDLIITFDEKDVVKDYSVVSSKF